MIKFRTIPHIFLLILIFFILIALNNCSNPVDKKNDYSYQMFYLQDSTISYSDASNLSISELALQSDPFLSAENIKTFRILYLNDNPIQSYHIILKDSLDLNFSNKVRPFVLKLNGDRYYVAEYWPSFMSIIPKSIIMYRMSKIDIELHPGDDTGNSTLKSPMIMDALNELGIEIIYINIDGN